MTTNMRADLRAALGKLQQAQDRVKELEAALRWIIKEHGECFGPLAPVEYKMAIKAARAILEEKK